MAKSVNAANGCKRQKYGCKGTAKGADDFLIKKRRNGMQVNKARRASMLHDQKVRMRMNIYTYTHENNVRTNIDYTYTHNIVPLLYRICLLTTCIPKNECRLYIAYIGTKGTNRMNVGLLLIATERKTESTYKERNYI